VKSAKNTFWSWTLIITFVFLHTTLTFLTSPSLLLGHMYHTKYTPHHKTTSYKMSTEHNTCGTFTSLLAVDVKFMNSSERQYFNTECNISSYLRNRFTIYHH